MKKIINKVLFGKDTKLSGFIALTVIMLIALGCTCGGLDKFKENSSASSSDNKSSKSDSTSNSSKDSPFPSDSSTPKKEATPGKKSSDKDMPSDEETNSLVKDLVQQFRNGVENEDFADMRNSASTAFKKTYTTEKVNQGFDVFIKAKERVGTVLEDVGELTPEYTDTPIITKKNGFKILTANGTFATSPTTTFKTSFVLEKGEWKMLTIEMIIK
jgi:hypothetical protein